MTADYRARVAAFLALPDAELFKPLWNVPPADRRAFLAARECRCYAKWTPTDEGETYQPSEAMQPVTSFADTE